jgi:nucleoside-diphosphate-sugar epimerase
MSDRTENRILVTGAGGYVGSVLTPKLLSAGYEVVAYDTFWYGEQVLKSFGQNPNLRIVKGDIRNLGILKDAMSGVSSVIHLACISNDPSFDLDPALGKSINLDSFEPMVLLAKNLGVQRFIYASSSSVYGVKEEERVTESLSLEPLTDYSRFKMMCEETLLEHSTSNFHGTVLRPATVCGISPRLRLDLSVNILTISALTDRVIKVFGGTQYRPNVHIQDICNAYLAVLKAEEKRIENQIFNVGVENLQISKIAEIVSNKTGVTEIDVVETSDLRSYRVDSTKFISEFNFTFNYSVSDAVEEIIEEFNRGLLVDPKHNSLYYNIKRMKELQIS